MGRWVPFKPNQIRTTQAFAIPKVNRVIQQTVVGAKFRAPRSSTHTHGSGRPVAGPRLQATISAKDLKVFPWRVTRQAGTPKRFAESITNGSRAHRIIARRKSTLKFRSKRAWLGSRRRGWMKPDAQGFVYPKSVLHPGNSRRRTFLTTPLKLSARVNGFKYRELSRRV